MPRPLRAELFDPSEVGIVHCIQRCVRRAFLAGQDPVSGKNYEYRREWIRARLECLASVFGLDVLTYAILSNHMHVVLRTRPDVVAQWSDQDVARRWLSLFPGERVDEFLGQPTQSAIDALVSDAGRMVEIRLRLSNPSWFMRALAEPIARLANQEDECTGRFWEGRFKAQAIRDEAGLLACSMYVDLNPIRAAMAQTPEESVHTSAYDRIEGKLGTMVDSAAKVIEVIPTEEAGKIRRESTPEELRARRAKARKARSGRSILRDAWLAPLALVEGDEKTERTLLGPRQGGDRFLPGGGTLGTMVSSSGVRASDKGFLSMGLEDYLRLLKWTGANKPSIGTPKVSPEVEPILKRLGIDGSMWLDLVWGFKKYFTGSAAGSPESMQAHAVENHRRWRRGQRAVRKVFA
jgi:REP element-mobilizing transposase RayT